MSYEFDETVKKFSGTTVLYDGKLAQICDVTGDGDTIQLEYVLLPYRGQPSKKAYILDSNWDFTSLASRIGYVNVEWGGVMNAVYCSRLPKRQTRQGLDTETVQVVNPLKDVSEFNWNAVKDSPHLNITINNLYPSLKSCVQTLIQDPVKNRSLSVSRRMAVVWDRINPPNLLYRRDRIGYTEDGETVKLAAHKHFLYEELTDMMGLKVNATK